LVSSVFAWYGSSLDSNSDTSQKQIDKWRRYKKVLVANTLLQANKSFSRLSMVRYL
jgi:hypothetical protein